MIQPTRIRRLNDRPIGKGKYVLYWMQASQRVPFNHALEHAVDLANERSLPLVVCFGLMDDYPEANERHYAFMLQGLRDVEADLRDRGIRFVVKHGHPSEVALHYAQDAACVVCDRGYLRHQRAWRDRLADEARCEAIQVESDVVVPVEEASDKQEHAARTIRPKIHRKWAEYLVALPMREVVKPSLRMRLASDLDVTDPDKTLGKLKLDHSVPPTPHFIGGARAAGKLLDAFVATKLNGYAEGRNEPAAGQTSTMSAYLHFGHVSPLQLALTVRGAKAPAVDRDAYLEELIVRRELAVNYCYYSPVYDRYDGLPEWARKTLSEHRNDKRYHVYSRLQLELAETHDPYWNAAQREMNLTGFMHNYMRMYWGKKIIEWSATPQEAFATTLYLNNRLFLCGRNANAYANVAWVFGLHDRPWGPQRSVFGTVRYMNDAGLRRKFDMDAYVQKVAALQ